MRLVPHFLCRPGEAAACGHFRQDLEQAAARELYLKQAAARELLAAVPRALGSSAHPPSSALLVAPPPKLRPKLCPPPPPHLSPLPGSGGVLVCRASGAAALVEHGRGCGNCVVTSSINGILERLGQKEGGAAMTTDQITRGLEDLQCTTSTDDPEAFTFDLRKMVEACRNEEIESLVKKKYGQEAFTIFRLLDTQGCPVETDQIIDTTILDKQIVHSTLYKLWKDDYTDTEKIASAPGTGYAQFFVWRAKNTFHEQFIDNLYHAALNLRQMVNYVAECIAVLLKEDSEDKKRKLESLNKRRVILIVALTRHDDSLMLFHDF